MIHSYSWLIHIKKTLWWILQNKKVVMRKVSFCDSFSHQKEKIIITKILSPYHGGKLTFRFHRFKNTPFYSVASAQPFWYNSSWNPKKLKFARVQLTGKLWKKLSWFFNVILLKKSRNFFNTSNLCHEVVQMKTDFKSHGNFFSLFFFWLCKNIPRSSKLQGKVVATCSSFLSYMSATL